MTPKVAKASSHVAVACRCRCHAKLPQCKDGLKQYFYWLSCFENVRYYATVLLERATLGRSYSVSNCTTVSHQKHYSQGKSDNWQTPLWQQTVLHLPTCPNHLGRQANFRIISSCGVALPKVAKVITLPSVMYNVTGSF